MRRQSFVGPLLLIGIGALLLARNLYPELPLADYIARFWPFVLIAWGVLRLIEILVWRVTAKSIPAVGVSGPEWVFVLFLCFFGAGLHAIRGINWPERIRLGGIQVFGEAFEYPLNGEHPASMTPQIILEGFRGNVQVTGTDSNVVHVMGRKTIRAIDQAGADQADRETPLEITGDPNHIVVRIPTRTPPMRRVSAIAEISVPKGASIETHDQNGDVHVTGIKGAVNITGRGGDLQLEDIEGPVSISGANWGNVQLKNLSKPLHFASARTEFDIEQVPGDVRLNSGDTRISNATGPIHMNARSQDVEISDFTNSLDISVGRGDLNLRPGKLPLARIQARVGLGDVHLSLPPTAQFNLTASTQRGEITNDFGSPLQLTSDHHGATLRGSNGSGPNIRIETQRGEIVISKAASITSTQPLQKLDQ